MRAQGPRESSSLHAKLTSGAVHSLSSHSRLEVLLCALTAPFLPPLSLSALPLRQSRVVSRFICVTLCLGVWVSFPSAVRAAPPLTARCVVVFVRCTHVHIYTVREDERTAQKLGGEQHIRKPSTSLPRFFAWCPLVYATADAPSRTIQFVGAPPEYQLTLFVDPLVLDPNRPPFVKPDLSDLMTSPNCQQQRREAEAPCAVTPRQPGEDGEPADGEGAGPDEANGRSLA